MAASPRVPSRPTYAVNRSSMLPRECSSRRVSPKPRSPTSLPTPESPRARLPVFESKAQLLVGLQARYNRDLALRTARLVEGRGDRLARLDGFLSDLVDYHESQFALHHVLFHEAALSEDEATRPLVALFKRFIEEGVASGEFAVDDPEFSAVFLLSGLHGVLIPYLHHRPVSRRRFLKQAREVARRTLVQPGDS